MGRSLRYGILALACMALEACKPVGAAPKSLVLNDFERVPDAALLNSQFDPKEAVKKPVYPMHDFDLGHDGYASWEAVSAEQARAAKDRPLYKFVRGGLAGDKPGRSAVKVRFSVPADYLSKSAPRPASWESGFSLSTETHTRLKATDWSSYRYLSLRAYNPGTKPLALRVRFTDATTSLTVSAASLPPGESAVDFDLNQLREARLKLNDVRGLAFLLDTAGLAKDPYLLFDDISLQGETLAARVKAASEEGAEEGAEEEDWEGEDEEAVRQVPVVNGRPAAAPAPAAAN